jgi:polyphosphate kinase
MTSDMDQVFTQLASQTRINKLNHLLLAPFHLQDQLIDMVDKVSKASMHGAKGRIILKMNSLTDEKLARQLVLASQRGVEIDLIVRGACILPAQRPGFTERIRVRSIIGRFLEHSRVYYFRSGNVEDLYLSSADWMNRNMMRRIEIAWPVLDKSLQQKIIDECLVAYLYDNTDAWELQSDGNYVRSSPLSEEKALSAQIELMNRYRLGT